MKEQGEPITMLTAYDYPSAKLAEEAEVDMILVGDSLGMVVLGYDSTVPVTVEDMIHHTKAVRRGAKETFIVTDMPFMSYHVSLQETMVNARRIVQESGTRTEGRRCWRSYIDDSIFDERRNSCCSAFRFNPSIGRSVGWI